MYEYLATIIRVVDGDTVHADVDQGLDHHQRITFRLEGIDAPELGTPGGEMAKRVLTEWIEGKTVLVRTIKDRKEKYGRYRAVLFPWPNQDHPEPSYNIQLVERGLAVQYSGGARG